MESKGSQRSKSERYIAPTETESKNEMSKSDVSSEDKLLSKIIDCMIRLNGASDCFGEKCMIDIDFLLHVYYDGSDSERVKVGDALANLGITKLFAKTWKESFKMEFLNDESTLEYKVTKGLLSLMHNYTDASSLLCSEVLESDLPEIILSSLDSDYLDSLKTSEDSYEEILSSLMGILHNMLQKVPQSSESLREHNAVDVFQRFRNSPKELIAFKALVLQGYIITEEENAKINSDDKNFIFMREILEIALNPYNHERCGYGLKPAEIISALNRLAVNDENKDRIVKAGLLPFYVQLLQPGCSEEEQSAAAEGLWTLVFKCWEEVENEPGCVAALRNLTFSESDAVKRHAEGALWQLEDSKPTLRLRCGSMLESTSDARGHVFISYQWGSQPMTKRLAKSLKQAGYNVWIDVECMSGSILEAMANAVENAAVVIICLTQRYKDSPNCRTEAEYTFRKRKDILPLCMQPKYWPDGWLGALIGNSLVHDFSSEEKYKESIRNLIRELGDRGKAVKHEDFVDQADTERIVPKKVIPTHSAQKLDPDYVTWSEEEVVTWLQKNGIEQCREWFRGIDGSLLAEYKEMHQTSPDTFYSMLKENRFSLEVMLKLSKALKQL